MSEGKHLVQEAMYRAGYHDAYEGRPPMDKPRESLWYGYGYEDGFKARIGITYQVEQTGIAHFGA